jgi:hypothetical protein
MLFHIHKRQARIRPNRIINRRTPISWYIIKRDRGKTFREEVKVLRTRGGYSVG